MSVVIAGGTGFIGQALARELLASGRRITVITRNSRRAQQVLPEEIHVAQWDGRSGGSWEQPVVDAGVVINLAGESIGGKRWTAGQKKKILQSRLDATGAIVRALVKKEPSEEATLFISASGKDFYGDCGDDTVTEDNGQGGGFLAETCGAWERAAMEAENHGAHVSIVRLGLVIEKGGALDQMMLPYKLYVGGTIGSGRQWVSWIHLKDVVGLMLHLIEAFDPLEHNAALRGPFNATAPEPVTMKHFGRTLAKVMRRPSWFPVPAPMLRLALGEMADLMLVSQRIAAKRTKEIGFDFQFPSLEDALVDVLR